MKNINRDYLVTVDAKTAKVTSVPKEMIFFTTDENTSNIFFQLEGLDSSNSALQENADIYTLTLRVVKPNNEPKTIEVEQLGEETSLYYVADLDVSFVDIPGFYECELFIDTNINERTERSTSDPFEYEVKESIFYNLDDIIDTTYISIEDIATKEYVNKLAVGGVSLDGYATKEQLNAKDNKDHVHNDYVTQTQLDEALVGVGPDVNLENLVVANSISLKRKEYSIVGQYSTAEGYETTASGDGSHAEGGNTKASSYCSHAEGDSTAASGDSSHAEGFNTIAGGPYSHAEGFNTIARGNHQHVQGKYNIEDRNTYAHIVGNGTSDDARSNAHTLDWKGNAWFAGNVKVGAGNKELATKAYVDEAVSDMSTYDLVVFNSISMGRRANSTIGQYSTALGYDVTANGARSHAEGGYTTASGPYSHAEGMSTTASGTYSHAEGYGTTASGIYSHAEGDSTIASSTHQHAQGKYNIEDTASVYAHIVGNGSSTARSNAHTLDWDGNAWFAGNVTIGADNKELATKEYVDDALSNADTGGGNVDTDNLVVTNSISMGRNSTWAIGQYSTAVGNDVIASGFASHAEGSSGYYYDYSRGEWITQSAQATGTASHAEGAGTRAHGDESHAEGLLTIAWGDFSHAEGERTYAAYDHQHVQGRYNRNGDYAHIVGNGYDADDYIEESNCHTLDWDGNAVYAGTVTATSHPTTSDRTLKENINYISNAATINDETITLAECYNFIKDDLAIATYNYIADEDDRQKIGFIAQDLLYNEDQTDNKVGQLIIDNFQGTDMGKGESKLTYDSNNLFGVMLAAMQVMANKIEYLEQKLENIEGDK